MPVRAPRACGHCGGVHRSGERCAVTDARDRERKARFDKCRPSASRRGYDREWQDAARAFLSLAENQKCARCGAPATVVMHRISIRRAPNLRMEGSNWRAGCHRCNAIEAARERHESKG